MSEHLIESHDDGVATLTMNRPEARNAMSGAMMEAMQSRAAAPGRRPQRARRRVDRCGRCVLRRRRREGFCRGASAGGGGEFNLEQRVHGLRTRHGAVALVARNAEADARGHSRSGGRRGSVARARVRSARRGRHGEVHHRVLEDRSGRRLRRFVFPAVSRRRRKGARVVLHRRRRIRRRKRLQIGLVNHVFPAAVVRSRSRSRLRSELANLPTVALGYMKKNLNAAQHGSLADVLDLEAMHMIRTFMTDDHKGAARRSSKSVRRSSRAADRRADRRTR